MAGLEADVSSYPKPQTSSFLDVAGKLGNLQSNALQVQRQKLDLVNTHYNNLINDLSQLGPNPTPEAFDDVAKRSVKFGRITPEMYATVMSGVPKDPDTVIGQNSDGSPITKMGQYFGQVVRQVLAGHEKVNSIYGTPGYMETGQTITPIRTPMVGGPVASGNPIQIQPPPTTPAVNEANQPTMVGPQPAQIPAGTMPAQGGIPGQYTNNPVNKMGGAVQSPQASQPSLPRPAGMATGASPDWLTGQKMINEDRNLATQRLTAIKPAMMALDKMKGLQSGPGTPLWNESVAFLKANNVIPTTIPDNTAVYQEVNKYLNQYIQKNGSRSDAELAQKEASNPNISTQINPALIELTKNTIAQDRLEAARAGSFTNKDYSKYPQHRALFPNQMDLRVFKIDLLEPKERQALIQDMLKKKNTPEGKKFWSSLNIADKQGLVELPQ